MVSEELLGLAPKADISSGFFFVVLASVTNEGKRWILNGEMPGMWAGFRNTVPYRCVFSNPCGRPPLCHLFTATQQTR